VFIRGGFNRALFVKLSSVELCSVKVYSVEVCLVEVWSGEL
jgi:hypothetical protein